MTKRKRIRKRILRIAVIILSVLLGLAVLLGGVPLLASIGMQVDPLPENPTKQQAKISVQERWIRGAGKVVNAFTPMPKGLTAPEEYYTDYFYEGGSGTGTVWCLGYAQAVITPEDWESKAYFDGGNLAFPARRLKSKLDDIKVRVIALATGHVIANGEQDIGGVHIFAAVDSIGVTNKQVLDIRALVTDLDLQSVNIAATHTHSAPDGVGIYSKGGDVDEDYLAFVNEKTAGAVREAVAAMEPGRLHLSQIGSNSMEAWQNDLWDTFPLKDEADDEWTDEMQEAWQAHYEAYLSATTAEVYGLGDYIWSRRNLWSDYPTKLTKLRFVPLDDASRETMLVNFSAHPYTVGLKLDHWAGDAISGDFPYYMEEVINEAGANFIFFNGAINGIYPERMNTVNTGYQEDGDAFYEDYLKPLSWQAERMGRDFAAAALAMTMTPAEITENPLTDPEDGRSVGYRAIVQRMLDHGTVEETELAPRLEVRLAEVQVELSNPVMRWAAKRGKLNYTLLRSESLLVIPTEVGYADLGGGALKIAMAPGEFTPSLAWRGGAAAAEYAYRAWDFASPTFSESAGQDVIVFGLCNDEIGYVVPDSDYSYIRYQELLSPGPRTASAIAEAFAGLADGVN